jgi:ribonuclease I
MFYNIMKGAAGTLASVATSTLGKDDGDKTSSGTPGDFDMYLLAMSWAPRFCCTNNKQCKNEGMEDTDDLSVHGLW